MADTGKDVKVKDNESKLQKLFREIDLYRTSKAYKEFIEFARKMPSTAAYNAMLAHIQLPGALYVATRSQWARSGREVKAGARPLVVLKNFGPVDFVYDVSETTGGELPPEIAAPFRPKGEMAQALYDVCVENLAWDGVEVMETTFGSQQGGVLRMVAPREETRRFRKKTGKVTFQYIIELDSRGSCAEKFAAIAHEMGHLYCGHLGQSATSTWPDRKGLPREVEEFEAESVAWLACERHGIENPSAQYMAGYLENNETIPTIDMWLVFKAVGQIDRLLRKGAEPRPENFRTDLAAAP